MLPCRRFAYGVACALVATFFCVATARANTIVYGLHNDGVYTINTSTGAETALWTGAPFTGVASSIQGGAQRPSDGLIFFLFGTGADQQVYTYNPYSPATAPVLLGSTGASVQLMPRFAFDGAGTLWGVDGTGIIYTVSQTTGVATATGHTVTGVAGSGGDFAIDSTGKWWFASGTLLYSLPNSNGGAATSVGTITTGSVTGIAFGPAGVLFGIDNSVPSKFYSINTGTGAGTLIGTTTLNDTNFGDLASIIAPDAKMTKASGASFTVGTNGTYTITVDNLLGSAPTSGTLTVTDVLPAGLTYVSGTGTGWACGAAGQTVTCTSTTAIAAGATGNAITLTVGVDDDAYPSVSNTATVTGGNVPTINASDGTGVKVTTVNQQPNSGAGLMTGPIDTTEATFKGADYTGSYDGVFAAGNNYDFTARSIPFTGSPAITNTGTVAGTWIGASITAASVTVNVPSMLYYTNPTNAKRVLTLTPSAPAAGWTVTICPDNGVGTAGSGTGGNGPSTACAIPGGAVTCPATPAANGWLTTGATATYCSRKAANGTFNVVYWAEYVTPSSGLVAFTRYDGSVSVSDDQGAPLSNITHDELYAGFIPVTKTQAVVTNGCPAGVTPPVSGICAGGAGMIRYTLDFRNIMVGAGIGTQGQLLSAFLSTAAGQLTIADNGVTGSNLGLYSNGLASVMISANNAGYTTCSATANTCGTSIASTTYTGNALLSTSWTATIGGATFVLKPSGITGATTQGTVIFAVTIK